MSISSTSSFSAKEIADYFIWKSNEEKEPITNKKLQKLLYYAQAWNLVINKRPIFKDKIEAWIHGPTVRDVYFEYKDFGYNPIAKEIPVSRLKIPKAEQELLDNVWRVYGEFDADYLEKLTHREDPWREARAGLEEYVASDNEISQESMTRYYTQRLKDARQK